jgi:4-amino-4-deoxy-L-arabinose transferase-like glycosyltransferase
LTLSQDLFRQKRFWWILSAGVAILWIALHLFTLDRYPYITCDESFYGQVGYNFLSTGNFGVPSTLGLAGTDRNVLWPGRLYELSIAAFQLVFGPTPRSARMVSFAAGLLIAYVLYRLGKAMYKPRVGLAAAVIFQVSWTALQATHSGRPEALMAAAGILEAWLLWRFMESPSFGRGFVAGIGASLVVDVHPNGMYFAFAAGMTTVLYFGYKRSWKPIGAFAVGGAIGLAYVLAAHLLPDPPTAIYQATDLFTDWGLTPWAETQRANLFSFYWKEFVARHYYLSIPSAIYFAFGLVYAALDKSRGSRFLVGYFALANIIFAFVPGKQWYYATIWVPLFCLMTAAGLEWLAGRLAEIGPMSRFSADRLWVTMLLPLLLMFLAGDFFLLYKFRRRDYVSYLQQINEVIPSGATMVAEDTWWFARPDEPFVTISETIQIIEVQAGAPMSPAMFTSFLNQVAPAYVVMDPIWSCHAEPSPIYDALYTPVDEQCEHVGSARAEGYLTSEIYYCETLVE